MLEKHGKQDDSSGESIPRLGKISSEGKHKGAAAVAALGAVRSSHAYACPCMKEVDDG